MQATIHETEMYLEETEYYEENNTAEDAVGVQTGARRVVKLALILLLLILATAVFLFLLMPAIQSMIQPPMPALAPAVQV